jgi:hypothetical protein
MTDGLFRSEQIFKPRSADYVKIDYISSLARIEGDHPEKKKNRTKTITNLGKRENSYIHGINKKTQKPSGT